MNADICPVILCGGSGTRLWPLSREAFPKQFLQLSGDNSFLQNTLSRAQHAGAVVPPIFVANEAHRFIVAEQIRKTGQTAANIILEPIGRNTAPATAAAAMVAMKDGQDPILLVMPSDHIISDKNQFRRATEIAEISAREGRLVTFGITPTEPATGYGYVRTASANTDSVQLSAVSVLQFVEKPNRDTAEEYISRGDYYWNSGIFMVRASVYLQELTRFAPEIVNAVKNAVENGGRDADFLRLNPQAFLDCPADSIDYAVMEKTERATLVPLNAGWSDVGAWDAVWQITTRDGSDNALFGDTITEDSSGCLVHSDHRLVVALGVKDLVVVETADAVLVTHRAEAQNVKKIVERVRSAGRTETNTHRRVYRPWGSYNSIDSGSRYQVKSITVNPGAKLSLQMHHHRAEHWIVVSGTAKVRNGEKEYLLSENQSTYIPIGEIHSLENPGKIPLELIEVQSGAYLDEDDIVRISDVYGRV